MAAVLTAATSPSRSAALRSTAYHEAGHAMAGYALGRPLKTVTIVPTEDKLGHVRFGGRSNVPRLEMQFLGPQARHRVEQDLVVTLAGGAAERRLMGRANYIGARYDHAFVADVALTFAQGNEREADAYVRWLTCRSDRLVEQWWPQIQRLADSLMEVRTVTVSDIDALFADDEDTTTRKGMGFV